MHFTTFVAVAFAAVASATPFSAIQAREANVASISLPTGCTLKNLGECVEHLASTGGSCATAVVMGGVDPIADLACVASAAGTAANIDECKSCIPKTTKVTEG